MDLVIIIWRKCYINFLVAILLLVPLGGCGIFAPSDYWIGVSGELVVPENELKGCTLKMYAQNNDYLIHAWVLNEKQFRKSFVSFPPDKSDKAYFTIECGSHQYISKVFTGKYILLNNGLVNLGEVKLPN